MLGAPVEIAALQRLTGGASRETWSFTANGDEDDLRKRLMAPALDLQQSLYVSPPVKTGRVMVKDEDVCLHCGLCAERCPTGAWDMQKFEILIPYAGTTRTACSSTCAQA